MIIGRDPMLKLGMIANFKRNVPEWDGVDVHTEQPNWRALGPGKPDFTKGKIRYLSIQTVEPVSTNKSTERTIKVLDSTHERYNIKKVVLS